MKVSRGFPWFFSITPIYKAWSWAIWAIWVPRCRILWLIVTPKVAQVVSCRPVGNASCGSNGRKRKNVRMALKRWQGNRTHSKKSAVDISVSTTEWWGIYIRFWFYFVLQVILQLEVVSNFQASFFCFFQMNSIVFGRHHAGLKQKPPQVPKICSWCYNDCTSARWNLQSPLVIFSESATCNPPPNKIHPRSLT